MDPTHRIWMSAAEGYMPNVPIGQVMRAFAVGDVVESKHAGFKVGDTVSGLLGVQAFFQGNPEAHFASAVASGIRPEDTINMFGINGLTAWVGLIEVGQIKAGETVVVSAAAGAVGLFTGQIAKAMGCRVVGITSTAEKVKYCTEEMGFDACINYTEHKSLEQLTKAVKDACPQGVDCFFDNVGGPILDAVLANLAMKARVVICGAIHDYNAAAPYGSVNLRYLLFKRASMSGFIFIDYAAKFGGAIAKMLEWIQQGKLKSTPFVEEQGLRSYVKALNRLFSADKIGKVMIRV